MGFVEDLGDAILKTDERQATSGAANAMSNIALGLAQQTDPLRKGMISNWENMLSGDYDVTQSPMYGPVMDATKYNLGTQFNRARDNIMGSLPKGGGLQKAIADSYLQEAGQMTNLTADLTKNIWQDEYSKAYGMASGAPQQAISGLGGSGALSSQIYGSKLGKGGDLGAGAGYYLGSKA